MRPRQFPFPADFDDGPLCRYLPNYPSVDVAEGLRMTFDGFSAEDDRGFKNAMLRIDGVSHKKRRDGRYYEGLNYNRSA